MIAGLLTLWPRPFGPEARMSAKGLHLVDGLGQGLFRRRNALGFRVKKFPDEGYEWRGLATLVTVLSRAGWQSISRTNFVSQVPDPIGPCLTGGALVSY